MFQGDESLATAISRDPPRRDVSRRRRRHVTADELVKLAGNEATIIFLVDGQGRGGELQVRGREGAEAVWGSVLSPSSVL